MSYNNETTPENKYCIRYKSFERIPYSEKVILLICTTLISLIILLVDACVMIAIKKTRQLSNQSIHLNYTICILDIMYALLGNSSISLVVWAAADFGCIAMIVINFILDLFNISSPLITLFVVIDRFLHIKYRADYSTVFTWWRYKISLLLWVILSITLACSTTIITILFRASKGKLIVTSINMTFALTSCGVYCASYVILHRFQRQNGHLSTSRKQITDIARLYFTFYLITHVLPMAAIAVIQSLYGRLNPVTSLYVNFLPESYTIINTTIFVYVNKPTRRYFLQLLRRSTVHMAVPDNNQSPV